MNIFIDGVKIPVNPEELKIDNSNEIDTASVLGGGELPISIGSKLKSVEWESFIPGKEHDGSYSKNSFIEPKKFVEFIENKKSKNTPVRLILTGVLGVVTNSKFLIEEFNLSTKVGYENDVIYSIKLKEFKEHTPRKIEIKKKAIVKTTSKTRNVESTRPPARKKTVDEKPKNLPRMHTVVRGDCLWKISKKYYGKGSVWRKIYNANKSKIKDPHWIYPGQKFIIP